LTAAVIDGGREWWWIVDNEEGRMTATLINLGKRGVPDASKAIRDEIARIVAPLPPQDRERLQKLIGALVTNEVQDTFAD
jgi:hypothetical protein